MLEVDYRSCPANVREELDKDQEAVLRIGLLMMSLGVNRLRTGRELHDLRVRANLLTHLDPWAPSKETLDRFVELCWRARGFSTNTDSVPLRRWAAAKTKSLVDSALYDAKPHQQTT